MTSKTHARVLIIGASVAGLTLANAFEQTGIDYLLLEQWHEIAPQLGAGIAVFPNGARILDQLGCFEPVIDLMEGADAFETMQLKDEHGKVITSVPNASKRISKLLGYGPFFIDRRMLIQALFDHLKVKTRILTSEKVVQVEQTANSVKVVTKSGKAFSAEVLVGADGIHSNVRREMRRLAQIEKPGYFVLNEGDLVRTQYCCMFGISNPTDKFTKLSCAHVQGNHHSYLLSTGPKDRIYWFLFKRLKNPMYGLHDKIPRYTEAEQDALALEHANDPLGNGLCFGELYNTRTIATLQALPEVVFSKWHYGRIITIGDAAHKFNPIGGQGGNSAIEDAAVLANELFELLKSKTLDMSEVTSSELENVFQRVQSKRHERTKQMKDVSALVQNLHAKESWIMNLISRIMGPDSPDQTIERMMGVWRGAARLEILPMPKREYTDRFDDERPAKKQKLNKRYWMAGSVLVGVIAWTTVTTLSIIKGGSVVKIR